MSIPYRAHTAWMRGKRVCTRSGSRWRRSSVTGPRPSFTSCTMARATRSRAASSSVNRSPFEFRRYAPSPRTASETRNRGAPSMASAVGWNCVNSMSCRAAPARHAMATPSPVATGGFVVSAKTWPAPPVARRVARARTSVVLPSSSRKRHPVTRPSLVTRSMEQEKDDTRIAGVRCVRSSSDRTISHPVASPRAWSTRFRECAPSRVKWSRPASRSNLAPQEASSRIRSGPSSTRTRAAASDTRPAPAFSVSSKCSSVASSTAIATATPPCA
jgi:hypothetical protein